jgi:hypothetical protein
VADVGGWQGASKVALMTDHDRLTGWRLARRSLGHRSSQTWLIVLVSALISGTAVFAAGYQHVVQQAAVEAILAVDGAGNSWSLTGAPRSHLPGVLPPGIERLTTPPVAGRIAALQWRIEGSTDPLIKGGLRWRAEACAHVALVSGQCPSSRDDVAVSTADARNFGVEVGDRLTLTPTLSPVRPAVVSGIYQVNNAKEPYWFDVSPVGRSLYQEEVRLSDDLLTDYSAFADVTTFQESLDIRVDGPVVRLADLDDLANITVELRKAPSTEVSVVTGIPDSLHRISQERQRAVAGLTLSLAQLAVLVGVVLALLAAVELTAQRPELGLARLRGEPVVRLRRMVAGRWAAVITAGWLIGWVPGLVLLGVVTAMSSDGQGLLLGPALVVVPLSCLLVMVGVISVPARTMLAQPVTGLLRSAPSAVRESGGRQVIVDVGLLIVAVSGLVVAVQVGTDSVLGLLVPSLLAVGAGVALYLVLVRLMARRRRLLAGSGTRPAALLHATLTFRLRGLRLLVVATSVAAAFAVFAVQVQAIGSDVRRHDAEVRTGAAAVLTVDGDAPDVVRALARFDPRHSATDATVTPVVVARRKDPEALRGMFVEPAAFARLGYGADRTTAADTWAAISAPRVDPVQFRGDIITAQVGRHDNLGRATTEPPISRGTQAELGITYYAADGVVRTADLGRVALAAGGGERLTAPVLCRDGCNLVRITLTPDGPMEGTLPLTSFAAGAAPGGRPIALQTAERWSFVPSNDSTDQLAVNPGNGGPALNVRSAGGPLAVQDAWVPVTLPVLLAAGERLESKPTVAAPDGSQQAVTPVAETADAVPRELDGVAVADLESVLRAGRGASGLETEVQVWASDAGLRRLGELEQMLDAAGIRVVDVRLAEDARSANRTTAAALSAQIAPGLAALAGLFALLGVALTVFGQQSVLGRDLAALQRAGLRRATVHRAATATYLVPGLLAVLLGAAAGTAGCLLVIPELPMLADAHPAIHDDVRPRLLPLAGTVALAAGALTAVVLFSVRRLSRGPGIDTLGERS